MELFFEFIYWVSCLVGAAMAYASFHYLMKGRVTHSLAIKHHSELMMVLCFSAAITIAVLAFISCLRTH